MQDYRQKDDPYKISEYTAQSAIEPSKSNVRVDGDQRGNTVMKPRGVPTQAEADAIKNGGLPA